MNSVNSYLEKMRGGKSSPRRAPWHEILVSVIGGFTGILAVYAVGHHQELQLQDSLFLVGSFGASAVLIFAVPNSPYSQPRNLIGGHVVSAFAGVCCVMILQDQIALATASAVAVAILLMHVTRTIHPPGGATALIAVIGSSHVHALKFWYILTPIAAGAVIMLIVALVLNNLSPYRRYPQFWL